MRLRVYERLVSLLMLTDIIYLRPNIVTIVSVTVYSALLKQFASCQICKKTGTGQMRAFGLKTDNNTNCDCCSVQLFIFARETTDTYFK